MYTHYNAISKFKAHNHFDLCLAAMWEWYSMQKGKHFEDSSWVQVQWIAGSQGLRHIVQLNEQYGTYKEAGLGMIE